MHASAKCKGGAITMGVLLGMGEANIAHGHLRYGRHAIAMLCDLMPRIENS